MSQLVEKIAAEIGKQGPISFARFMELALYCPVYGYYEKEEDTIGRRGDYYTSVSVGSLFGEMLAWQFAQWLGECGCIESARTGPAPALEEADGGQRQIVEAGAHRGELAGDILRWLRDHRPELYRQLDYWLIEPSDRRRSWQEQTLAEFAGTVRWAKSFSDLSRQGPSPGVRAEGWVRGLIFANELLDALPAHRLGWDARRRAWFEWGVGLAGDRFVWSRLEPSPRSEIPDPRPRAAPGERPAGPGSRRREWPEELAPAGRSMGVWASQVSALMLTPALAEILPDGFTLEVCPAAVEWWREAAGILGRGKLLTIDYGFEAEDFFRPERAGGSLRAYYRHHLNPDVLAQPGQQDLTTHVNFTALQQAGEAAGLNTERFASQAQFLTGIAPHLWQGEAPFGEWTPQQRRQFLTLTHPEHLGRPFRVLIQSRGLQNQ